MYKYTLDELKTLAEKTAEEIEAPYSILLYGNIGAGKTTFSQFFIEKLLIDHNQKITSPTFNIIQIYDTIKGSIWHADLYRIKNENEIFQLGIIEAMHESICLIEWPDILQNYISDCRIKKLVL